jgi:hypothetical protein
MKERKKGILADERERERERSVVGCGIARDEGRGQDGTGWDRMGQDRMGFLTVGAVRACETETKVEMEMGVLRKWFW